MKKIYKFCSSSWRKLILHDLLKEIINIETLYQKYGL